MALIPQDAIDFLKSKELTPSFDYRDVWQQEHAYSFAVAKAMQMDVLSDIHAALIKAIENGETLHQFRKELTPLLQRKGWWGIKENVKDPITGELKDVQLGSARRLRTIFDANMRTSYAVGQYERAQRTKKTHPYFVYSLGASREHREEHVRWAGIILPVDHSWWQTHFPPNGWGCKCWLRQISQHEYERLKATGQYITEAPDIIYKDWINKRTGEVEKVPEGIDPAWDHHPALDRQTHIQKVLKNKLNNSDNATAVRAANQLVNSAVFLQFLAKPQGTYPVAAISETEKQLLGAKQNTVLLSSDTLKKQRAHHPELTDQEYQLIPDLIAHGRIIQMNDGQRMIYFSVADRLYKVVVKATQNKQALYLVTFYRTKEFEFERDLKRGKQIR